MNKNKTARVQKRFCVLAVLFLLSFFSSLTSAWYYGQAGGNE